MSKICPIFFSLELYCDQTVLFFQVFSIVLKSVCPLESKNTFVLVLAIFLIFKEIIFLAQNDPYGEISSDQFLRRFPNFSSLMSIHMFLSPPDKPGIFIYFWGAFDEKIYSQAQLFFSRFYSHFYMSHVRT